MKNSHFQIDLMEKQVEINIFKPLEIIKKVNLEWPNLWSEENKILILLKLKGIQIMFLKMALKTLFMKVVKALLQILPEKQKQIAKTKLYFNQLKVSGELMPRKQTNKGKMWHKISSVLDSKYEKISLRMMMRNLMSLEKQILVYFNDELQLT